MSEIVYHIFLCEVDEMHLKRDDKYIKTLSQQLKKRVELHSYCYKGYEELVNHIHRVGRVYDIAILSIELEKNQDEYIMHILKQMNARIRIIKLQNGKYHRIKHKKDLEERPLADEQYRERFEMLFRHAMERAECGNGENAFLELVINKKRIYLRVSSIIWLEKSQKKVCYRTWNNYYEERNTIQNLEERLPDYFLRVNQSVMININEIVSIEGYNIIMTTKDEFIIGRTYQKKVKEKYMEYVK